ncbi:hypothetical protein FRC09_017372 [Ceratobasidium sp. 395]|nr:hypothetical protein FRC09_017372 [Ceratobasidium sp. 395]
MKDHSLGVEPKASSRALALPELFSLVCSFLSKKDCAACLCVSRHTFASIASIVWEDVDLKPILLLIPGMQFTTTNMRGTLDHYFAFEFPTTVDLARFEVYCPFVKVISTSIPYAIKFSKDWPGNTEQAPLQPLLPNLQSITINTLGSVFDLYVDWVPRLLTPNLKEFKMYSTLLRDNSGEGYENAWLSPSKCIELIDAISQICPTIETLEIFAHEDEEEDQAKYTVLCEKVAGLHSLRSLSFGGARAGRTLFRAFGRLPCLESLLLVSDCSQAVPDRDSPVILSDDSFPALRRLQLRRFHPDVITRVYDSPQLFRRLVSAEITYDDDDCDGYKGYTLRSAHIMKCLSHGCSNLANLSLFTNGSRGSFCVFRRFIPIFRQLPLRRLRLCGVDLNPELSYFAGDEDLEENDPKVTWEEFFAALPHLEELDLSNSFSTRDIVVLADLLPKLRYFSPSIIQATRTGHTFNVTTRSTTTQLITICCKFDLYNYAGEPAKRISEVARQIYEIWPNVEFKAYGDGKWAKRMESQLNEVIRALRQKIL